MKVLVLIDVEPKPGAAESDIRLFDAVIIEAIDQSMKAMNAVPADQWPWHTNSVRQAVAP